MKINVEVTQEDIRSGNKKSATTCPLALAISRSAATTVTVGIQGITFWRIDKEWGYQGTEIKQPKDVADWRQRYDAGELVLPFGFTLDVPEAN